MRNIFAAALLTASVSFAPAAYAAALENDPMIQGARMCTQYLPRHEREYGIPMHLLAAISSTESGRYHQGLGIRLPWPWTINAEGQGYFFPTKEEAIAGVQRLQAKGIRSIDVGCMQVNLMHHPNAFPNLEEAFDPAHNVSYAAKFLHDNFEEMKSWRSATAAYHSRTPVYGNEYVGLVFATWNQILSKVAQAKSGTLTLARGNWNMPKFSRAADVDVQAPKPANVKIAHGVASSRFRVLGSTRNYARQHGVLVIRPTNEVVVAREPVTIADNSPIQATTKPTQQFTPHAKIIHVGSDAVRVGSGTISVDRNPQMVFDN